jgi:hypothetical protein
MVYTFIKTDNTAAVLKIPSILTAKITTRNKNRCHGEQSFQQSQRLLSYSFKSMSFTEHVGSLLFSP